ncbi:MAG TPA: hypothetical protein VG054_07240, partial [Acidimicrobiales bacterium]|nr:hypothetical protein [Acidimicrobiales bacterium]
DRFDASEDTPDHWESRAIGLHDAWLLKRLGGTWDGPPHPDPGWEVHPDLADPEQGDPAAAASFAFPDSGPVAWKDPRVCLLLPHWLAHLPGPVAAVFVWRSPLSVARSLRTRDGMALADAVALWERYNRSGLAGLVGVDTFVTKYESVVEDPLGQLGALATWLGALPQFVPYAPHWELASAVASISPRLRRQQDTGDEQLLLDEHRQLVEHLDSLDGPHRPLTIGPPDAESAWTTALLDDRRQATVLRDTLAEHVVAAEALAVDVAQRLKTARLQLEGARTELANMYQLYEDMRASTSWRVTRPLRQAVALKNRKGSPSSG